MKSSTSTSPERVAQPFTCAVRTREGLTQVELAERVGINRRHISEMEHGKRTIGKAVARKLAEVLGADYRQLL